MKDFDEAVQRFIKHIPCIPRSENDNALEYIAELSHIALQNEIPWRHVYRQVAVMQRLIENRRP